MSHTQPQTLEITYRLPGESTVRTLRGHALKCAPALHLVNASGRRMDVIRLFRRSEILGQRFT